LVIPDMARPRLGEHALVRNIFVFVTSNNPMRAVALVILALAVPAAARAGQVHVKPADRAAINRLLDQFIPAAVAQKNLQLGWDLSAQYARTVSHAEWMKGNTSVQKYPAKGTTFHGWVPNYAYPGDVGFDVLLQPTSRDLGAWSFRAEAKKIGGTWKITTFYPVATFAPPGRTQTVLGPNDLGAANSAASAGTDESRLGSWVLLLPVAALAAIAVGAAAFVGSRWLRQRSRVREIQRSLAR
jgi:hypothetical protein